MLCCVQWAGLACSLPPVGGVAGLCLCLAAQRCSPLRSLPLPLPLHSCGPSWTSWTRRRSLALDCIGLAADCGPWLPRTTCTVKLSLGGSGRTGRPPRWNVARTWTCCCPWASPDRGREYPDPNTVCVCECVCLHHFTRVGVRTPGGHSRCVCVRSGLRFSDGTQTRHVPWQTPFNRAHHFEVSFSTVSAASHNRPTRSRIKCGSTQNVTHKVTAE